MCSWKISKNFPIGNHNCFELQDIDRKRSDDDFVKNKFSKVNRENYIELDLRTSRIENGIDHSKSMIESLTSDDVDGQRLKYQGTFTLFQLDEFHILKFSSTSLFPPPHELTIFI